MIWLYIMIQVLKLNFWCETRMAKPNQAAKGSAPSGKRPARGSRNDADEAREDSQAETNDMTAALNTPAAPAGGSANGERLPPPAGLLQRRYEKEIKEKEQAIKEKELLQKELADMRAQLDLAKSKVGDVVQVSSPMTPITPSAGKVRLKLL